MAHRSQVGESVAVEVRKRGGVVARLGSLRPSFTHTGKTHEICSRQEQAEKSPTHCLLTPLCDSSRYQSSHFDEVLRFLKGVSGRYIRAAGVGTRHQGLTHDSAYACATKPSTTTLVEVAEAFFCPSTRITMV